MIIGNIKNKSEFACLEKDILACFDYVKNNNLLEYEKGSHAIDGDRFFVNVVEYETTTPENRFWEAHREYLDIHVMLKGKEQIDLNFIDNMKQEEFVKKDDFLPLQGEKKCSVVMEEGDFLICYPNDAHRTAIAVGESEKIKKAIFKVRI